MALAPARSTAFDAGVLTEICKTRRDALCLGRQTNRHVGTSTAPPRYPPAQRANTALRGQLQDNFFRRMPADIVDPCGFEQWPNPRRQKTLNSYNLPAFWHSLGQFYCAEALMKPFTLSQRLFLVTAVALLPAVGILLSSVLVSQKENDRAVHLRAARTS